MFWQIVNDKWHEVKAKADLPSFTGGGGDEVVRRSVSLWLPLPGLVDGLLVRPSRLSEVGLGWLRFKAFEDGGGGEDVAEEAAAEAAIIALRLKFMAAASDGGSWKPGGIEAARALAYAALLPSLPLWSEAAAEAVPFVEAALLEVGGGGGGWGEEMSIIAMGVLAPPVVVAGEAAEVDEEAEGEGGEVRDWRQPFTKRSFVEAVEVSAEPGWRVLSNMAKACD